MNLLCSGGHCIELSMFKILLLLWTTIEFPNGDEQASSAWLNLGTPCTMENPPHLCVCGGVGGVGGHE